MILLLFLYKVFCEPIEYNSYISFTLFKGGAQPLDGCAN